MATLTQQWVEYKQMEKNELLGVCEKLNIDVIWKAWKDDIIHTAIDVQARLAKCDPTMNKPGAVTVTQFVSGYESLEPLPTARPRAERAERYGLIMKNDLITRCKVLNLNMGWKSSRADLIAAILNAEDKAGPTLGRITIKSTAPPTTIPKDQPMARQTKYYNEKSRNFVKRRCRAFRIARSKRRLTSQLTRNIIEMEGKNSGAFKIKHVYVPKGPDAPPLPDYSQFLTTNGTNPTAGAPRQNASPWPAPHPHANHADITVIYPEPTHGLVAGTGLPIATRQLHPMYERYQNATQMPMEMWYEPLSRTPRMAEAAAKYNEMSLSHLQAIVKARGYTRGIEQDCDTKLDCIDILLEDDRKTGLLPAAPAPVYTIHPGKVLDTNPDPQMFIRNPTEMQVDVLMTLQTSLWEADEFQLSREEFYEKFSMGEMEREVLARRVTYVPHVRRQLVRSDMRIFERVRRRRAGLIPRGDDGQATTSVAAPTTTVTTTVEAKIAVTAPTLSNPPSGKTVGWADNV